MFKSFFVLLSKFIILLRSVYLQNKFTEAQVRTRLRYDEERI